MLRHGDKAAQSHVMVPTDFTAANAIIIANMIATSPILCTKLQVYSLATKKRKEKRAEKLMFYDVMNE